jgi:hypothetical protein
VLRLRFFWWKFDINDQTAVAFCLFGQPHVRSGQVRKLGAKIETNFDFGSGEQFKRFRPVLIACGHWHPLCVKVHIPKTGNTGQAVSFRTTGVVLSRMSALGQKQTYAPQKAMSALPPTATAKADMPQW